MGPEQVLPHSVEVNLGIMAVKKYFKFPRASGVEPHHQIQISVIPGHTLVCVGESNIFGVFYNPQPTG